jgi:hypothetical protein
MWLVAAGSEGLQAYMSSQTGTPAPWPAGTEVPVVLGANVFSADPGESPLSTINAPVVDKKCAQ